MTQLNGDTMGDLALWILEHSQKYKECSAKNEAKNVFFEEAPQ